MVRNNPADGAVTTFDEYAGRYPDIRMKRDDGILQVTFSTDSGPFVWSRRVHRDLGNAFTDVAADRENRIVILTGAGGSFMDSWGPDHRGQNRWEMMEWDGIRREAFRIIESLLDIEAPVIAAVNGPATVHSEIPIMSDVVLASENAYFQETAHLARGGVPGDGMHVVWPTVLGMNRGRYYLLVRPQISAREALNAGIVSEVLAPDRLLDRAWEIARDLNRNHPLVLRHTRLLFTMQWKRLMNDFFGYGFALEGLATQIRPLASGSTE